MKQKNSTVYILHRLLKVSLVFLSLLFLMIFVTKGSWAKPQGQLNPTGITGLGITGGPGDDEIRSACNSALQNQSDRFEWAFLQVNSTDIQNMTSTNELLLEPAIDLALAPAIDLVVCTEVDTPEEIAIKLKHPSSSSEYLQPTTADESIFHRIFSVGDISGTYTITAVTTAGYFTRVVTVHAPQITFVDGESGGITDQFTTMNDVEIHFQGFTHQNPVTVMLFRDVPAVDIPSMPRSSPRAFAPVARWSVDTDHSGNISHHLTDYVPTKPTDNVRGYYVLLACYDSVCSHLPGLIFPTFRNPENYTMASVEWPNLLVKFFKIGAVHRDVYLENKSDGNFSQVSPQNADPHATDTLVLAVAPEDEEEVATVAIDIRDSLGRLVHTRVDTAAPFCAFDGAGECQPWQFATHGYRWPNGQALEPGMHTVDARIYRTRGQIRMIYQTIVIAPVFVIAEDLPFPTLAISTFSAGQRSGFSIEFQGFKSDETVNVNVKNVQTQETIVSVSHTVDNIGCAKVRLISTTHIPPGRYYIVAMGNQGSTASYTFVVE